MVTIDGFTLENGDASGLGMVAIPAPPGADPASGDARTPLEQGLADPRSPTQRATDLRAGLGRLADSGLYPGGPPAYEAALARLERLTARAEEARARAATASPQLAPELGPGTGGGLYSQNASLHLLNSTIIGNVASQDGLGVGGGVFAGDAPTGGVRIEDNLIAGNLASVQGEGWGGGLYRYNTPGAIVRNNVVEENVASSTGSGYGGGAYVYSSPGLVVQDTTFLDNLASDTGEAGEGIGGGLALHTCPDALVQGNQLERNMASGAWNATRGIGGGLFVTHSPRAAVQDNQIRENVATLHGKGAGGGMQYVWSNFGLVAGNEVTGNLAGFFCWDCQGGGIKVAAVYSTTVSSNEIRENAACMFGDYQGSFGHYGGGFQGTEFESSRLSDNTITTNATCHHCGLGGGFGGGAFIGTSMNAVVDGNSIAENAGALLDGLGVGGGLQLRETSGSQVLRNQILRNRAGMADASGGGLVMDMLETVSRDGTVDGNLILDNRASGDPAAISVNGGCTIFGIYDGFSFTNNVVAGNQAAHVGGASLSSFPQGGTVTNNTVVGNGDVGLQIVQMAIPVTLTNNIVVSHTVGISVMHNATATVRYTLWAGNGTDIGGAGVVSHTHPVTGSPDFVDPASDDYHLSTGSAAVDAGDPAGVPPAPDHDADELDRPWGPAVDLGAYEWPGFWRYLPLVAKRGLRTTGWAAGHSLDGYGVIIHTTDGGETWVRQGSAGEIPDVNLGGVAAIDVQNAWVVGEQGTILRTKNGGRTWQRQAVPAEASQTGLCGVYAVDSETAWVAGADWAASPPGVILHTSDGGSTWTRQAQDMALAANLCGVYASDGGHAWVVGANEPGNEYGTIVRTTDGGITWERIPYSLTRELSGYYLISVHGVDANTVWAVGRDLVVHTSDGGLTWIDQNLPVAGYDVNGVFAVDHSTVWVVTDEGGIFRSDDGGGHWAKQPAPPGTTGDYILRISAVDGQTAWSVTQPVPPNPGHVLHTADGGQTWIAQTTPVSPAFWGVSFVR